MPRIEITAKRRRSGALDDGDIGGEAEIARILDPELFDLGRAFSALIAIGTS